MRNLKRIFFVLFFVGFIGFFGFAVLAMGSDFSEADFNRISPFNVRSLWLLRQIRYIIESYQVDAEKNEISEDDLLHGAARGMVEAWKDPYTRFVSPAQLKDEEIELEGHYGGLGMYIGDALYNLRNFS